MNYKAMSLIFFGVLLQVASLFLRNLPPDKEIKATVYLVGGLVLMAQGIAETFTSAPPRPTATPEEAK